MLNNLNLISKPHNLIQTQEPNQSNTVASPKPFSLNTDHLDIFFNAIWNELKFIGHESDSLFDVRQTQKKRQTPNLSDRISAPADYFVSLELYSGEDGLPNSAVIKHIESNIANGDSKHVSFFNALDEKINQIQSEDTREILYHKIAQIITERTPRRLIENTDIDYANHSNNANELVNKLKRYEKNYIRFIAAFTFKDFLIDCMPLQIENSSNILKVIHNNNNPEPHKVNTALTDVKKEILSQKNPKNLALVTVEADAVESNPVASVSGYFISPSKIPPKKRKQMDLQADALYRNLDGNTTNLLTHKAADSQELLTPIKKIKINQNSDHNHTTPPEAKHPIINEKRTTEISPMMMTSNHQWQITKKQDDFFNHHYNDSEAKIRTMLRKQLLEAIKAKPIDENFSIDIKMYSSHAPCTCCLVRLQNFFYAVKKSHPSFKEPENFKVAYFYDEPYSGAYVEAFAATDTEALLEQSSINPITAHPHTSTFVNASLVEQTRPSDCLDDIEIQSLTIKDHPIDHDSAKS